MMKKALKFLIFQIRPLLIFLFSFFFKREYLTGRHFDTHFGYIWAIKAIYQRSILRLARPLPFPVCLTCSISRGDRIFFHADDLNNFQSPGTYFQNFSADIYLGRGVYIGPNSGIITDNHDVHNLDNHVGGADVRIGDRCWLGMNTVVLPGVVLGDATIVAAGAVVTKSFPDGGVVLGGVPAKIIKYLDSNI